MSFFKRYIFVIIQVLILKISAQEYRIKNITIDDGLPSNIVYDIKQDKIGYLWIATEKGLVKYDGDNFIMIHNKKTTTVFIDGETVYSGLENGLFIKNKSGEQIFKSKKVTKIIRYNNSYLIGTIEGIYRLKNNDLVPVKLNTTLDFAIINDLFSFKKQLFICSSNGLYKGHKQLNNNDLQKLKNGFFTSIEKSYSSCIASELNGGVFEIKNDTCIKIDKTFGDISSIKKLTNELWITSKTNGVEVYTLPSFSFKQKINKYNSLHTNNINTVFKDHENTVFIASKKGVYTLKKAAPQNAIPKKPNIYFENLQVNYKDLDTLLNSKIIKLPYSENNIAISFKTVSLSFSKKIQYKYRLNGIESPWSNNNTVQFPNLNTGNYVFQVQSKINDQISVAKKISFSIDAPFYKKAWFIFTVVILFLIVSYISLDLYIIRINTANQKKLNQLKLQNRLLSLEQKALQLQMNPHFIFNVLNGIKAMGNNGETSGLNTTITKFSILLRGILNNSRKEEIALYEEIVLLKNYIELEQRMNSKSFSYTIDTSLNNIDSEEILIPTMLIQPFIENSIHHAFDNNTKGEIKILFEVKFSFLHVTITDNGIGIHQSQKRKVNSNHKSLALKVTRERLQVINPNSKLDISEINKDKIIKGTKVTFKIPLKTDY